MKKYLVLVLAILFIVGCGKKEKVIKHNKKITELTRLDFGYSTSTAMNGNVSYNINCNDKCILTIKPNNISEENKQEVELDKKTISKIIDILNKYDVFNWDGFKKSDLDVLDGNSFHMYLTIQNKKNISASGYMMYPKNYGKVENELNNLLGGYYKMSAKIKINNKEYVLSLENNTTTKSFINLLPAEYTMQDLNNNEKYIYLNNTLPIDPISPKHINKGDVMLYSNNCIVLFYKSFDTSYSYTKIGHIDNLDEFDNKDIVVKIYND